MFIEIGIRSSLLCVSKEDPQKSTVMFQGPENALYNIFPNSEIQTIVEASSHVYDGTMISRWLS